MPIALHENVEVGADRTPLLVGFRSCFTYTDRTQREY